ncbi:MAG: pilin [Candidatus Komeilibacteria bacterium]
MFKLTKTIPLLIFVFSLVVLIATPALASNSTQIQFIPSTTIPGSDFVAGSAIDINSGSLGQYILAIYNYGIGLVAVLAVVMIMFGGYKWIFAAGNASSIGSAKSTIISALVGLVLALGSYLLLNTINPALTTFEPLYTPTPKIGSCPVAINNCAQISNFFTYVKNEQSTEAGVEDAKKYYATKLGLTDAKGNYTDNFSMAKLTELMCKSEDVQAGCGIYPGMCIWNSSSTCQNITAVSCSSDADCTALSSSTLCETQTNHCSFGLRNSACADSTECNNGLNCVDNKCFALGEEGDECDNNNECAPGLVCTDEAGYPDVCRPQSPQCTAGDDDFCRSQNGWEDDNSADCNYDSYFYFNSCDCDGDSACSPGYKCFDTKNGANDVCLPAA